MWRSPAADIPLKKRIVRVLIEEIVATATVEPPHVSTTMIYRHVLNRGPAGVRSPADRMFLS